MKKFEMGKTYTGRFISNADATFSFEVLRRTAKSIWIKGTSGEIERKAVLLDHDGDEMAKPFGSYSMAPLMRAGRFE